MVKLNGNVDSDITGERNRLEKREKYRQTTIESGYKVVVVEEIERIRDRMEIAATDLEIDSVLSDVSTQFISLEMLEKTGIGKSLTRLKKRCESEKQQLIATNLLNEWKSIAKLAIQRRKRFKSTI